MFIRSLFLNRATLSGYCAGQNRTVIRGSFCFSTVGPTSSHSQYIFPAGSLVPSTLGSSVQSVLEHGSTNEKKRSGSQDPVLTTAKTAGMLVAYLAFLVLGIFLVWGNVRQTPKPKKLKWEHAIYQIQKEKRPIFGICCIIQLWLCKDLL